LGGWGDFDGKPFESTNALDEKIKTSVQEWVENDLWELDAVGFYCEKPKFDAIITKSDAKLRG
jgi:hypothetical protein